MFLSEKILETNVDFREVGNKVGIAIGYYPPILADALCMYCSFMISAERSNIEHQMEHPIIVCLELKYRVTYEPNVTFGPTVSFFVSD